MHAKQILSVQELASYAVGVPPDALKVLKFQDSAHIKLALEVS